MTRYGNPWTYVFRDVLYEATDINSALKVLSTTHRTCAIHVGLGSATDHSFRMLEYAQDVLNNYNDQNYTHYAANHPKKEGLAYFDKHVQPSGDNCVGQLLTNVIMLIFRVTFMEVGMSKSCTDTLVSPMKLETHSWQCSILKIR
jgi:hypothetical protein